MKKEHVGENNNVQGLDQNKRHTNESKGQKYGKVTSINKIYSITHLKFVEMNNIFLFEFPGSHKKVGNSIYLFMASWCL